MPLVFGDEAAVVLPVDFVDALLVADEDRSFSGGMTMSFFEIVTPAFVAYLNPSDLIVSSTGASVCAP